MACAAKSDSNKAVPDGALDLMQLLSFGSISLSALVCAADVDKIFDEVFAGESKGLK